MFIHSFIHGVLYNLCWELHNKPTSIIPLSSYRLLTRILGIIRKGRLHSGGGQYGPMRTKADKGDGVLVNADVRNV